MVVLYIQLVNEHQWEPSTGLKIVSYKIQIWTKIQKREKNKIREGSNFVFCNNHNTTSQVNWGLSGNHWSCAYGWSVPTLHCCWGAEAWLCDLSCNSKWTVCSTWGGTIQGFSDTPGTGGEERSCRPNDSAASLSKGSPEGSPVITFGFWSWDWASDSVVVALLSVTAPCDVYMLVVSGPPRPVLPPPSWANTMDPYGLWGRQKIQTLIRSWQDIVSAKSKFGVFSKYFLSTKCNGDEYRHYIFIEYGSQRYREFKTPTNWINEACFIRCWKYKGQRR